MGHSPCVVEGCRQPQNLTCGISIQAKPGAPAPPRRYTYTRRQRKCILVSGAVLAVLSALLVGLAVYAFLHKGPAVRGRGESAGSKVGIIRRRVCGVSGQKHWLGRAQGAGSGRFAGATPGARAERGGAIVLPPWVHGVGPPLRRCTAPGSARRHLQLDGAGRQRVPVVRLSAAQHHAAPPIQPHAGGMFASCCGTQFRTPQCRRPLARASAYFLTPLALGVRSVASIIAVH